ncbi:MAG TPA: hypothetical protein GX709_00175 [Clostridiales bacterium]|nr:hypothetical protein [Clostridiales bacterium]
MAKKDKKNVEKAVQVAAVPVQEPQPMQQEQQWQQSHQWDQQRSPRPARPLQLTPIIQPIAFVPYSTQQQELYMWEEEPYGDAYYDSQMQAANPGYNVDAPNFGNSSYQANAYGQGYYGGEGYNQGYGYNDDAHELSYGAAAPVEAAPEKAAKKKKGASGTAIVLLILSLVAIALIVIGKFVDQSFLMFADETSGLDMIINFFTDVSGGFTEAMIMPIAVLVAAVGILFVFLGSLFGIMRKGATVFTKIGTCIAFIGALVGLIVGLIKAEDVKIEIGYYILVGLSALILIIAFAAKNAPKEKKAKKTK